LERETLIDLFSEEEKLAPAYLASGAFKSDFGRYEKLMLGVIECLIPTSPGIGGEKWP
jgi:hypothetical protein